MNPLGADRGILTRSPSPAGYPDAPNMNRRHFLSLLTVSSAGMSLSRASFPVDRKFRVAVIGHTGRGNYGHGEDAVWLKIPEAEIVGLADADPKGLEAEQKKLRLEKGYADYREMLSEVKPDIVTIAPRFVDEHREMTLAAIAAGALGIYMEKPFCRSPEEADELVAAAEAKGVKISIAHRNRFHPVLPVVRKLIQDGTIGKALEMRARGKEDKRGGAQDLWVLGAHLLNLACYFGGEPVACSAAIFQDGRLAAPADVREGDEGVGLLSGNEVHARYELEHGLPLFFDSVANAGTRESGFGLQVIGTKGIIDFRLDEEPLAHLLGGNPFRPRADAALWQPITTAGIGLPEPIPNLGPQVSGHVLAVRDLMAAIREDRAPLCDAWAGRTTVEMICAVFESHRLGGRRVTFPLRTRKNPFALS